MIREYNRKLVFEDGNIYEGYGFGEEKDIVCEVVFNTSMVGYQEILSDPSYTGQGVVMTYPLIGNYGMAAEDYETRIPTISALIVGEYNDCPSNFRSEAKLGDVMRQYHIAGIHGIDTRRLTRYIRDNGCKKALLTDIGTSIEECRKILKDTPLLTDAVSLVSTKEIISCHAEGEKYHIVAVDCGIKQNMIRSLLMRGCQVTAVPFDTTAEKIRELMPDGILISNGPGNPEDVPQVIETIRQLHGKYPIFGICLGHQLICLSYGAKTYKLKFGHRGGNHPVRNLLTGKIEITSQNHSYAVAQDSLADTPLEVTHINLLDNTVEGVRCERDKIFSVQYHPESAPGPEDSAYLFDLFLKAVKEEKENAEKNRY